MIKIFGNYSNKSKSFHFDLFHETTHLGDRLFFLPLINYLIHNGYSVSISDKDIITRDLFRLFYPGTNLYSLPSNKNIGNVIIPMPSFLAKRKEYSNCLVIDFMDTCCQFRITKQAICSVSELLNIPYSNSIFNMQFKNNQEFNLDPTKKYFLFNNYIHSGSFRKLFINEKRLLAKAIELKSIGYTIVHVGSKFDRDCDSENYPFVDIDLRGLLSVDELIGLSSLSCIIGALTYDNFLMHLMGIFNKKAYILFRGRFSKKNYNHHLKYVNNTFFVFESNITYL